METQFANIRTSYNENPALFNALEKAQEAYGEARNRIYNEGEYANWEDAEQMDEALIDYAKDVTAAFENELKESGYKSEGYKSTQMVDSVFAYVKEKLEGEVPAEHKQEIGW